MKSLTIRDLVLLFSLLIIHSSCQKSQSTFDGLDTSYPSIQYPADNPPTEAQISLGEKLFHEPILSLDSSISCSSCHKLEYALGDNLPVSPGVQGSLGHRNSPSLFNVAFQPYFMREGGVPTLEMQVLVPLQDENEMHFNIVEAVKRLNSNSFYRTNFLQSTGDTATYFSLVRAISNYERTLIDFNSPLDKLISGDEFAFSDDAYEGGRLFYSKAGCYQQI
jgi:cytochrome c peroxidase